MPAARTHFILVTLLKQYSVSLKVCILFIIINLMPVYKNKPGFSLVEIVISLTLIVGIMFTLFSSIGALTARRGSDLQTIATKIASRQMETLRNTEYASLPNCPSGCSFADSDLSKLPQSPAPSATQTLTSYQSSPDIKLATVQVNWYVNGAQKSLKIETLIYTYGI